MSLEDIDPGTVYLLLRIKDHELVRNSNQHPIRFPSRGAAQAVADDDVFNPYKIIEVTDTRPRPKRGEPTPKMKEIFNA